MSGWRQRDYEGDPACIIFACYAPCEPVDWREISPTTMQIHIIHPDPALEYAFVEGCSILESWNNSDDAQASIARARVAPGVTTRWHVLRETTERYLILSGTGEVEVGDRTAEAVAAGDVVVIPPGIRQRIRNSGTEDLVFYAICTPRFTPACYEALD